MNKTDKGAPSVTQGRAHRRVYEREFKMRALELVSSGMSCLQVARELGVSTSMLSRWRRESRKDDFAFRGHGRCHPQDAEFKRLRHEMAKLQAEHELLKKVSARFALIPNTPSVSLQSIERCGRLDGCVGYSMSRTADITTG